MDKLDCIRQSRELMDQYRLSEWKFVVDYTVPRWSGLCTFRAKIISISLMVIALNEWPIVKDIVLHEIAHALAGPTAGHGHMWRVTAMALGCNPRACHGYEVKR